MNIKRIAVMSVAALALAGCTSEEGGESNSTPSATAEEILPNSVEEWEEFCHPDSNASDEGRAYCEDIEALEDEPENTPLPEEEAPKYIALKSPSSALLDYHDASYWDMDDGCDESMVNGTTYEGYRAKTIECYTSSNYEAVSVYVLDNPSAATYAELQASCEWSMYDFCQAGPGWVIEAETEEALQEVLKPLVKE